MSGLTTYSDEQAQARLRETLTGWSVEGGHLRRHFATDGWRASMLMANGIAHLAEMTWHHPDLRISWGGVDVALRTHSEDAISDKDFELAEISAFYYRDFEQIDEKEFVLGRRILEQFHQVSGLVRGQEGQVEVGLQHVGELDLGLLRRLLEPLQRHLVLREVDPLLALELGQRLFQHRRRINKHPVTEGPTMVLYPVCKFLQSFTHQFMVVTSQRIARNDTSGGFL